MAILNVLVALRSDVSLNVMGMSVGPGPSVPAMAVARSCCTVPMVSPVLASFEELSRLGRMVCT